jgi:N-acetylmuramoyl-L-alanine amidase
LNAKGDMQSMASIYISPSKQEDNIGYGDYGTEEVRMNQIAEVVCNCLDASNIIWYRNSPSMTTTQIVEDSNSKNPDFHLALHSNAGGGRGAEVFIYDWGDDRERLARIVYEKIAELTPTEDRGVKLNASLAELNGTTAPAALIEYGFHDNPEDAAFILDNIQTLGVVTAQAVCEYFNVPFVNPYVESGNPSKLYRVQVGAFTVRENAERASEELKKLGYDNFIVEG